MKLCLVTEYFNPDGAGGTPSTLPSLARELLRQCPDLSIDIVTSRNIYRGENVRLPAYQDWEGMRVFRLRVPRSNQPSTGARLAAGMVFSLAAAARICTLPRYDLLLVGTNPPPAPMAAGFVRRLRKTPYVYLIHDLFPDVAIALHALQAEHPAAQLGARRQHNWLHNAARVVVLGRCMRDYLVRKYQVPAERIDVIPNWADPDEIRPLPHDTAFRRAHGLTGFILLYAGNFGQYQDFDTLLNTAKHLQASSQQITVVLVGDGARKTELAQRITTDALTNVRIFPFVSKAEFADLLASADVSLVTLEPGAEAVGVPSKLYTILASGRPVIATVASGSEVAMVLDEANCGLRVDPGDAPAMTEAILRLAADRALTERMGQNARAVLESQFTLTAAVTRFTETLYAAARSTIGANVDLPG
ncbi:MAG: glycosyltransferase family 4 protein [Armatimonadota bacterium]